MFKQGKARETFSQVSSDFGLEIFNYLCVSNENENVVFSPLCLQLSFSLLISCASKAVANEFEKMFVWPEADSIGALGAHNRIVMDIRNPNLVIDFDVMIDSKISLISNFRKIAGEFLRTHVSCMHFHQQRTQKKLIVLLKKPYHRNVMPLRSNFPPDTIGTSTSSNVSSIAEEKIKIMPNHMLVTGSIALTTKIGILVNTSLVVNTFFVTTNEQFDVEMLRCKAMFNLLYSRVLKARVLELPLLNNFSMYLILPFTVGGLPYTQAALANFNLHEKTPNFRSHTVDLHIPKFNVACESNVKNILNRLGVTDIFQSESSNFPGISSKNLAVDGVVQTAMFDFEGLYDPEGLATTSIPEPTNRFFSDYVGMFIINHPFLFLVSKKGRDINHVFIGRYSKVSTTNITS